MHGRRVRYALSYFRVSLQSIGRAVAFLHDRRRVILLDTQMDACEQVGVHPHSPFAPLESSRMLLLLLLIFSYNKSPLNRGTAAILLCLSHEKVTAQFTPLK